MIVIADINSQPSSDEICDNQNIRETYRQLLIANGLPINEYEFGSISGRYNEKEDSYICLVPYEATTQLGGAIIGRPFTLSMLHEFKKKVETASNEEDKTKAGYNLSGLENSRSYEEGTMVIKVTLFYSNGVYSKYTAEFVRAY